MKGWLLSEDQKNALADALTALSTTEAMEQKYGLKGSPSGLRFARPEGLLPFPVTTNKKSRL